MQMLFSLSQSIDVGPNPGEFLLRQFKYAAAWNTACVPGLKNVCQFRQRETDAKRSPDNPNPLDDFRWIHPIAGLGSLSFRQDPNPLVVPNCIGADGRGLRQLAGSKRSLGSLHHEEYQP